MLVIGIAGGSGCGKTTVVKALIKNMGGNVAVISQDSYYRDCSGMTAQEKRDYNFDHPDSIEWDLLCHQLDELKNGRSIEQPVYSFVTSERSKTETKRIDPAEVILVEGILIFSCPELRDQLDIKIYVDADDDDRLMRIIQRDICERGKDVLWVIERYSRTVKPMHLQFIEPSKRYADIIIPRGGYNMVAIGLIADSIEKKLKKLKTAGQ